MTTAPITAAPSWEARADLVVVGSGVAGLTAALDAQALGLRVLMVTKDAVDAGSTRWAQGGVAVVLDGEHDPGDSVAAHAADTVSAGAGLAEPTAVGSILADGPAAVEHLLRRGAVFDPAADGRLARTREGGHSALRVLHAGGDATGAEVERALVGAARGDRLPMLTGHVAVDAVLETRAGRGAGRDAGRVTGLFVLDGDGRVGLLHAPAVLLATGGYSQLYAETTNPETATGDGLALALRAGALAADLEFVQFHPTALYTGDTGRRALVTEAVRGEGAVLVDHAGRRVMTGVHPMADLAPRDVVSAAITRLLAESGAACVYLDATGIPGFAQRFPTVDAACRAVGVDPAHDPIPVTPAAHYCCGGVVTDTWGRTGLAGLYAAGEVARTGLHGANRLASNSLLEGLVVGARAARAVSEDLRGPRPTAAPAPVTAVLGAPIADRAVVQQAMSRGAAIGRDAAGLAAASDQVEAVTTTLPLDSRAAVEDAAITLLAQAVLAAAGTRTESRGCHVRTDFQRTDDVHQRESLLVSLGTDGRLAVRSAEPALGGVA
jgi:L-aspartate oxidase